MGIQPFHAGRGFEAENGKILTQTVIFTFNSRPFTGYRGEILAAALRRGGIVALGVSAVDGTPRGAFCLMGSCQECLVLVGGVPRNACRAVVDDGLCVTSIAPLGGGS